MFSQLLLQPKPGRDDNMSLEQSPELELQKRFNRLPSRSKRDASTIYRAEPTEELVNKILNTSCNTIDALSIYTIYHMWCRCSVPCGLSISQSGLNRCNLAYGQRPVKRIPVNQFRYNYSPLRWSVSTNSESSHIIGISASVESKQAKVLLSVKLLIKKYLCKGFLSVKYVGWPFH